MNRRTFIRSTILTALGMAAFPFLDERFASAAWHTGAADGNVNIVETYLKFGPLENRIRTDCIVIHHIGNISSDVSAAEVHDWHLANGWSGIGYHYLIRRDGTIERGRPRDAVGAHCYHENEHTLGINIVGNFEVSRPTSAQVASAEQLLASLCRMYRLPPSANTIRGHCDFSATACPGYNLYRMLPSIINNASSLAGEIQPETRQIRSASRELESPRAARRKKESDGKKTRHTKLYRE